MWRNHIYIVEINAKDEGWIEASRHQYGTIAIFSAWWRWYQTGWEHRIRKVQYAKKIREFNA